MKKLLALTLLVPSISLAGTNVQTGTFSDHNHIRTYDNDTYYNPEANSKVKNSGNSESSSRSSSRSNLMNSGNSLSLSRGGSGGDSKANSRAYGGRSSVGDTKSKSRSKAYGGDSSSYTGASTSSVDNVSTGSNNVSIEGDDGDTYNFRRIPANTAYAPSLVVGTCLGSASAGGQGATFGFSMGKTMVDEGCARLREVIYWHQIGEVEIAKNILKQSKYYKQAYKVKKPKVRCEYPTGDKCTKHRYRNR